MTAVHNAGPQPAAAPALRTLIVLPTLDEADNVEEVLARVRIALPTAQVLVVDDGSSDSTPELAEATAEALGQIRILRRVGPKGLGPAYSDYMRRTKRLIPFVV